MKRKHLNDPKGVELLWKQPNTPENSLWLGNYSVVATSSTEVVSISRVEFLKLSTLKMIEQILEESNFYEVSEQEIQEQFIHQQQWSQLKQQVRKVINIQRFSTRNKNH